MRRLLHASGREGIHLAAFLRPRLYSTPGKVKIIAKDSTGARNDFEAPVGVSLLEAVRDIAGLSLDGTCDGCMQCSTCHVYVGEKWLKKLPPPSERELDLIDRVPKPKDESRLACQITLRADYDGLEIDLPNEVIDFMLT